MQFHIDKINKLLDDFDEATLKALEEISYSKTYEKGSYLLKADNICTKSFFLKSGILRKFYLHNEKDVTTEFYFKGDLAVSFDSYTLQRPSKEYLQALTDVTVNTIEFNSFQNLKKKHLQLQELDFLITEYHALWLEEKVFELHTQNATQRYETLIKKSPHIVHQIPLTQIASYLNVSLETLSRIRAKK
ncbi:MAG: Crp/Fnr family transcriptional regulator [Spirosomaceae bacterium]|nr:Crp/Fnr family transcriptional regulator [Spirosomataceae bacterium]